MSGVVTGDAVVLGLRAARLPSRALALAIDLALVLPVYLLISVGLAMATASLDQAARTAVSIAAFVLVLVGGPIAVETLSRGRSPGKLACGLRVVRDDGGPIRFRHALVRGAIGVVEILMTFGTVACIASLASERGRRVGDVFAGTLVVRERVPAARSACLPPPPPWLVGRFTEIDLSGVPDDLWLAVRQYLTRMDRLDAEVGRALAERLATDLAVCTGAPVPAGVPAGAYLAGVVHERQTRDARRAGAVPSLSPMPSASPSPSVNPSVMVHPSYPSYPSYPSSPSRPSPPVTGGGTTRPNARPAPAAHPAAGVPGTRGVPAAAGSAAATGCFAAPAAPGIAAGPVSRPARFGPATGPGGPGGSGASEPVPARTEDGAEQSGPHQGAGPAATGFAPPA
ncbi:RDD family protein [Streptomyces pacificus]|uniref:RDD family protein n=1 Tax=Streptomyces pacificus TaxID=2705029 RepID=UPI00156635E5|nr:RDD family protein [Streptomyces pacificus]